MRHMALGCAFTSTRTRSMSVPRPVLRRPPEAGTQGLGAASRQEGHVSAPSRCRRVHGAGPAVGRWGPAWENSASTPAKSKAPSWPSLGIVPATARPEKDGFGK